MDRKSFDRYIDDIASTSKLSVEEERLLSQRILQGDKRAIDKLTTANLKFVIVLSRQYQGKGVDFDDLVAEGNIALFKAACKYDATKSNCRFTSYAAPFVHKALEETIRKYDDMNKDSSSNSQSSKQKVSIEAPLNGRDNVSYLNILPNDDSPLADSLVTQNAVSDEIANGLILLNDRERDVIRLYFGINCEKQTMAEIASVLELKRERVRQIRDKALRKMRKNK